MTLKIPNAGEDLMLQHIVGKTAIENPVLKLYSNNLTPGETDTAGSYTEVSGNGYAAITLTGANWTITAGAPTEAAYAQQSFTFTGAAGNVYGYFVVGASSGTLLWAEKFSDGPYNITQSGDVIKVTPKLTLQDTTD
jgi:hypothetical protein